MSATILVVDDEKDLVNLVRYNLQREGYTVLCAYEGASVFQLVKRHRPHLVVLDLMLPDRSGFDICREMKADEQIRSIPVIMLTARSSEHDRISGFEAGAEDYVIKPFSPKELLLRIKAMLARTHNPSDLGETLDLGILQISPSEYRVTVAGQDVQLTTTEFDILLMLARYPNMAKTREQILMDVWQDEATEILDRTVDAQVKRLRDKLGQARDLIETVRGVGYRLVVKKGPSAL